MIADAFKRRPDLQSAGQATPRSAWRTTPRASRAWCAFVPTLSAVGALPSRRAARQAGDNHDVDATLALVASWSIFDGRARDADEQSRTAQAVIADLTADALQRQVDQDIRQAVTLLASAQAQLVAAKTESEQAEKSAIEEAILYRDSLAKAIELIDANESRFEAEVALAQAQDSVAEAYLSLRQAMGLDAIGTELK